MSEATKLHLILLRVEIALSKLQNKVVEDKKYLTPVPYVATDLDAVIEAIRDEVQCDAEYSGERVVMDIKELDERLASKLSINTLI